MQLHIRGNDIQVTDRIRETAEQRAARLDRFVRGTGDAHLELRHTHRRTGPDVVTAQLTLHVGHTILRVEEQEPDAVKAVDLAMDTMERRARRFHERRSGRQATKPGAEPPPVDAVVPDDDEQDEPSEVVRTKRFRVKPMGEAEAVEQMLLLGHDFFLFQDVDGGGVALVYRRRDGNIGKLVPEPM
jgi:putative sigma-54 modulation protein